ncbi:peptidoglycan-binding domain-containing protein [Roseibium aggregatum]|uniref:Peptidoglycan-binding protein n=1 Tax=Roseibium aggregatum TaxID=187304 RepID=A0A939EIW4_9HYPH|nr:peptidoglycan-binding domain-containing protein [Roseibium aggregatum]MBN9673970.1 peptidoglycan-binding protein [Roseibium aggregatum]
MPKLPGKSYDEMKALIGKNHGIPYVFSWELLIAICWEESLFNNQEQEKGTAWGFGQVEPSEFYKFETQQARQNGYYVANLPPRTKVGTATKLQGKLTDDQSVQVVSAALRHNYYSRKHDKLDALYAYGGVYYKGPSPLSKADRIKIIQGWLNCEKHLQFFHQGYDRDEIIKGLNMARSFKSREAEFRPILFPLSEDYLIEWLKKYIAQLKASKQMLRTGARGQEVTALQSVLNHKGQSQAAKLVEDGIFGQKTGARVFEFQKQNFLTADGIAGPKTKAKLTA